MSDIRVGPARDPRRFLDTDLLTWFQEPVDEPVESSLSLLAEDGRFAAEVEDGDPERYAGVYGVLPLQVTVPGPLATVTQVPVAGLTWVAVHPDERRRGVLTAMLADHFTRTRAGTSSGLSALHASESAIYGRHGYGIASWETTLTLSRGATLTAPGLEEAAGALRTRLVDADDAQVVRRVVELSHRVGGAHLGAVVLPDRARARYFQHIPQLTRDTEPKRVIFAQRDGEDVGYAVLRRTAKWEDHRPAGEVRVSELVGDPAAQLALTRRLVDLDLTNAVTFRSRSVDDLLVQWSGGPRSVHGTVADSLWLRLVDLGVALTARGYAAPCDVVLEVADARIPANDGRWRLRAADDGSGHVERTASPADVRLSTELLATAYLGGRSLRTALAAGLLEELRPGAVTALDAALRMPTAPVAAIGF
ncbi:MAG: GNAT family N-acetyltransferase [Lapillicoccus sp.]